MTFLFTLILCLFPLISFAEQTTPQPTFPIQSYKAAPFKAADLIINALTFTLEDGKVIRLDGIYSPDQFHHNGPGSFALQSKNWLEEHIKGKNIRAFTPKNERIQSTNRMGHIVAQAITDQGLWVQYNLLEKGVMYAWPSDASKDIFPLLLEAEKHARNRKAGLWAETIIRTPENVTASAKLQIIEGRPTSISTVSQNTYVNFGDNWREDFTVMIPSSLRRDMLKKSIDPVTWQGKHMRIRGFVEDYNGAMIKLTDLQQIELLE